MQGHKQSMQQAKRKDGKSPGKLNKHTICFYQAVQIILSQCQVLTLNAKVCIKNLQSFMVLRKQHMYAEINLNLKTV